MAVGGLLLKGTSVFLRGLQFLASIAVLGFFAYILWYVRHESLPQYTYVKAITGLSGASALYTLIAFFLVCCLGGKTLFAFLGIALDVAFIGAWIAIAILTRRGGTSNCAAARSPNTTTGNYNFNYGFTRFGEPAYRVCVLEKASFGIAIAAAILFLLSAVFQLFLGKHHQREKRKTLNTPVVAAPGKRRFWQRRQKHVAPADTETGMYRPSHDTAMTGATATDHNAQYGNTAYGQPKFGQATNY